MSELDDLRAENKELKRLLGNALELLEKSKRALTKKAQSDSAVGRKGTARRVAKSAPKKAPGKKALRKS